MSSGSKVPPTACPVDHKTRTAWLEHSRQSQRPSQPSPIPVGESCDSSTIDQTPTSLPSPAVPLSKSVRSLSTAREISSIPRATTNNTPSPANPALSSPSPQSQRSPANNEQETEPDKATGNWIYPSEQMFFAAMRRKQYNPQAEDMRTIIPIHNAVNERAWKEIKEWEKGRGADLCGGPRLLSFSGQASAMTPKARLNSLLGYQAPFDRHDWVVDRCGTQVEYVIDFYAGRNDDTSRKSLSFYLDVRPKLNSWEGWKMRAGRLVGL